MKDETLVPLYPYISIGRAATILGVHTVTLKRWHKSGKLDPDAIGEGGARWYLKETIMALKEKQS